MQHLICGRLQGVVLSIFGDSVSLTITIQQHGSERYTGQTIKCLAAIGTGPDAERAARRSVETMTVGGHYQVNGAALAAADSQLWLMGVDEWRLVAAPAVLLSFAEAA